MKFFQGLVLIFLIGLMSCYEQEPKAKKELVRRLTNIKGDEARAKYSPDGKQLVYQIVQNGNSDIHLLNLVDENVTELIASEHSESSPSWSPDGNQIVYVHSKDGKFSLRKIDLTTNLDEEIYCQDSIKLFGPDWSPDGKNIAATGEYKNKYYLWFLNLETKKLKQLTTKGDEFWGKWSPDGKDIIYYTGKNDSIMTVNFETGKLSSLTQDKYIGYYPEISPTNQYFAYTAPNNGLVNIWIADRSGKSTSPLTKKSNNIFPSWHPNGNGLVFSRRIENKQVYSMNLSQDSLKQLTSNGIFYNPKVSSLGTMAMIEKEGANFYISIKTDSSTNSIRVSESFPLLEYIDWSPDGSSIVFSGSHVEFTNNFDIGLYHLNIGNKTSKILDSNGDIRNPLWLDNSRNVIYSSFKESKYENRQLWSINVDTGEKRILFDSEHEKFATDSDSTGNFLLYTQRINYSENHIYKLNLNTLESNRILDSVLTPEEAKWSPDELKIIFRSRTSGQFDLSIYDIETGQISKFTNNSYKESTPVWVNDEIVFSMNQNDFDLWEIKFDPDTLVNK